MKNPILKLPEWMRVAIIFSACIFFDELIPVSHHHQAIAPLLVAGLIAGAGAVGKGISGAIQTSRANKALRKLEQTPFPEYTIAPELQQSYARAEGMAKMGFSPEETAAFNQRMARGESAATRSALDVGGGNLARTISAGLQYNRMGAEADFAARGAQLKRQNIQYADQLARQIAVQKNLMTQQKISRRTMLEQAYGTAARIGKENILGAFDSLTGIGMNLAGAGAFGTGESKTSASGATAGQSGQTEVKGLQSPYQGYNPWETNEDEG